MALADDIQALAAAWAAQAQAIDDAKETIKELMPSATVAENISYIEEITEMLEEHAEALLELLEE